MYFLFISHAEKDKKIAKALVDLLYQLGLKEENLFCSSISEIGVPLKEDIYEYLRNLLDSDELIPIFMLSKNYYNSAACLNEMGAVWIKQKNYFTFLLPDFTFKEIKGAINSNKSAIKLDIPREDLRQKLIEFKNAIQDIFSLEEISEQRWDRACNTFIDEVIKHSMQEFVINLNENSVYYIGDEQSVSYKITPGSFRNILSFDFNFRKTTARLCSLVFFTGNINLKRSYYSNQCLEFWLKASDKVKDVNIELHLSSINASASIKATNDWQKYSIPLSKFTMLDKAWECCREVCFLIDRNNTKNGSLEIKDIKII